MRTLGTFAFWRQFEACVNGTFELYSGLQRKRWGGQADKQVGVLITEANFK